MAARGRYRYRLGLTFALVHQGISIVAHQVPVLKLRIRNAASCGESVQQVSRFRIGIPVRGPVLSSARFELGEQTHHIGALQVFGGHDDFTMSQIAVKDGWIRKRRVAKSVRCLPDCDLFALDGLDSRLPLVVMRHVASFAKSRSRIHPS